MGRPRRRGTRWSAWRRVPVTYGPMDFGIGAAADGRGRRDGGFARRIRVRLGHPRIGKAAGAAHIGFIAATGVDYRPSISS